MKALLICLLLVSPSVFANELDMLTHVKSVAELLKKAKADLGQEMVQKIKKELGPALTVPVKATQKNRSLFVQAGHVSVTMEFSSNGDSRSMIVNQQELALKRNEDVISVMNKIRAAMPKMNSSLQLLWLEADAADADTDSAVGFLGSSFEWVSSYKDCNEVKEFISGCEHTQEKFLYSPSVVYSYFSDKVASDLPRGGDQHYTYNTKVMTYAAESLSQVDGHAKRCQPYVKKAKECLQGALKDQPTSKVAAQYLGIPLSQTAELNRKTQQ